MTDNLLDNRAKAFNDGGFQRFLACDPFEELVVARLGDNDFHTIHVVVYLNVGRRVVPWSNDLLSLGVDADVGRIRVPLWVREN